MTNNLPERCECYGCERKTPNKNGRTEEIERRVNGIDEIETYEDIL